MATAKRDPLGFIEEYPRPMVLDEVQRVPDIFIAIKTLIDRDRSPGQFLLTGSANPLVLPKLSESLAGRMEMLKLWPFSQGEISMHREGFVDAVFIQREVSTRRTAWFDSYVTTVIHRELRDITNIEYLTELPRLLRLLAARVGSELNYTEVSGAVGLPQTTVKRYLALLEAIYLFVPLTAWAANLGKRLIKRPKILLNDSGLIAYLVGLEKGRVDKDATRFGYTLECFVAMELSKQISWSNIRPSIYHFRTRKNVEVDLVLESPSGDIVGIEVKTPSHIQDEDLRGLQFLKDLTGNRFRRGIILYTGNKIVPLGKQFYAMPIDVLWQM